MMMNFPSKNLNVFTPKVSAAILLLLAVAGMVGLSWINKVLFPIGDFRVTVFTAVTVALAIGILVDARR